MRKGPTGEVRLADRRATGRRAVSNHTLLATNYCTILLCSHRTISSQRTGRKRRAPLRTAVTDSIDDQLNPFWQLGLPQVDRSTLFSGVLGVSGPSGGADQQWAIRHPGLVAGLAGLGEDSRASQCLPVDWRLTEGPEGLRRNRVGRWWWQPTACTGRQAWHGEQGCAQHRCHSLSKPQIKPDGQSQSNPDSTRMILDRILSLTSSHFALFSATLSFYQFSFSIHRASLA